MLFPDLSLARRLELHAAWSSSEHARTQAWLFPHTQPASSAIAGGQAVYCGASSPLSQAYGLGMAGPVSAADLQQLEHFYSSRSQPVRVSACPFADPSLFALLPGRACAIEDFMNVYVQALEPGRRAVLSMGIQVRTAGLEEARAWYERLGAGGSWAEPDGISFMTIRTTLKPGVQLFTAWLDGQPVGAGALEIHAGVAALMAADTLSEYRSRGVHTALLQARLAAAAAAGCDLAVAHTTPGSASERNIRRAGFQLAYTNVNLTWSPPAA